MLRNAIDECFPFGVVVHNIEIVIVTESLGDYKSPLKCVSFAWRRADDILRYWKIYVKEELSVEVDLEVIEGPQSDVV